MVDAGRLHLIVTTHQVLHLRRSLLGVACQRRRPDTLTVTCDGDDPAVAACVRDACREFGLTAALVQRAHAGVARPAQARNNAVRFLEGCGLAGHDLLVFLDGDCCPAASALEYAGCCGAGSALVIGGRIMLTPEQSEAFDEDALRRGLPPSSLSDSQVGDLRRNARKAMLHLWLRRLGRAKAHKPKAVGACQALQVGVFQAINGYDEEYEGWGCEDDDLVRRAYRAGARPVVAVERFVVFHQPHPIRLGGPWRQGPAQQRFMGGWAIRCRQGLRQPRAQAAVTIYRVQAGTDLVAGAPAGALAVAGAGGAR